MVSLTQRRLFKAIGIRMAMLAIALQLVLSFGHVHPLHAQVPAVSGPSQPAQPVPGEQDQTADCAICATIAAFASLDLPGDVAVIVPLRVAETASVAIVERAVDSASFAPFNSRAPPIV